MQETQVRPLSQEDPLQKGMATYSSILAKRIPWTEEPGGLQSVGCRESDMTDYHYTYCNDAISPQEHPKYTSLGLLEAKTGSGFILSLGSDQEPF